MDQRKEDKFKTNLRISNIIAVLISIAIFLCLVINGAQAYRANAVGTLPLKQKEWMVVELWTILAAAFIWRVWHQYSVRCPNCGMMASALLQFKCRGCGTDQRGLSAGSTPPSGRQTAARIPSLLVRVVALVSLFIFAGICYLIYHSKYPIAWGSNVGGWQPLTLATAIIILILWIQFGVLWIKCSSCGAANRRYALLFVKARNCQNCGHEL